MSILKGKEARDKMFLGIEQVADAVASTIGPKGRNVVFAKTSRGPQITNDGVTVAKSIVLEDNIENMGADLIKEVSIYTNDSVGDGTTTSTVLAYSMIKEGMKRLGEGVNVVEIKEGMQKAGRDIVSILNKNCKPVETNDMIKQVATISSQSEEVGILIADAMEKVGKDGVVTVAENLYETKVEINQGMFFDSGYLSPYMVTDTDKMEAKIEKPYILVTENKLLSIKDLVPLIEELVAKGHNKLVIIAEDIEGEALNNILANIYKGLFHILGIKAPAFTDRRKEIMRDICIVTGATLVSDETGLKLSDVKIGDLGQSDEIVSTKDTTIISGGNGTKEDIDKRVEEIKGQIKIETNSFQKEEKEKRIAKLIAGVATIKVGANTKAEMKEKKLRIEDALNATKAAISEGIVEGGGIALANIYNNIDLLDSGTDQDMGYKIVIDSLKSPLKKIIENAGKSFDVIDNALQNGELGYDAQKDDYCDMFERGIIDPKKVTRVALETAISIASTFLTTDTAIFIVEPPKEKPQY